MDGPTLDYTVSQPEGMRQEIEIPAAYWTGLWDYSRKAVLLDGVQNVALGRTDLVSSDSSRPTWGTNVIRVSHLRLDTLTGEDARKLGFTDPALSSTERRYFAQREAMGNGATLGSLVTLVEFA
jgi:hypothetical protein